jgi:glycosyltransferase involved in cell wall biosynthesis
MKILMLNYEYPPLGGGAGVITQNISERLAGLGHSVTVVTTWFNTEKEVEEKGNLKIIRLRSKRVHTHKSSVTEMLSWIYQSKKYLKNYGRQNKFDICFANFSIPGGEVAFYLKKKYGLKYTVISHGHDIPLQFPKQMRWFHLATYNRIKRICMQSEANFVQTVTMKNNIDKFLGEKYATKNILIPNGIDTNTFTPDYSQRSNIFKIVFAGRLVEQKDPFTFLKAIKLYAEKNRNFIVHIIGDGILRKGMENYVKANHIDEVVKFLGWISKNEIVKEYQAAHVAIVSSVFEGMSIAVLESLACGCFLITTPLDGIDEIITKDENGIIVNFHLPEEIAQQLEHYHNEKYLSGYKVSDMVMDKLLEQYNWDIIVKEYEKTFKQLINQ